MNGGSYITANRLHIFRWKLKSNFSESTEQNSEPLSRIRKNPVTPKTVGPDPGYPSKVLQDRNLSIKSIMFRHLEAVT